MPIRMTKEQVAAVLAEMGIRPTADILAERAKAPKEKKPFPILLPPAVEHGAGRWEVTIEDWRPTSLSVLMHKHWRTAANIKKKEAKRIAAAFLASGCTGAIGKRKLTMHIRLAPKQRAFDADNVWKGTKDGLKRCGAIKDDSPKWVDHESPTYSRGATMATTLILEDVQG